jgi:hypothetical protein
MLKLIEGLALYFLNRLNQTNSQKHPGIAAEFLAAKGRIIILSFIAGITLSLLFAGGLILSLVGVAEWMNDESLPSAHWFVYLGVSLSVICGFLIAGTFSKKRFNIEEEKSVTKEVAAPPPASQMIEEVVVAIIKEFMKSKKPEERETQSTTTAAPSTPTSVQTA